MRTRSWAWRPASTSAAAAVGAAAATVEEADVAEAKAKTEKKAEAKQAGKTSEASKRSREEKPALKTLKITWVKSGIGYSKVQKATIQSLGLRHLNATVEHPDTPQVRGQIFKVKHMLS